MIEIKNILKTGSNLLVRSQPSEHFLSVKSYLLSSAMKMNGKYSPVGSR